MADAEYSTEDGVIKHGGGTVKRSYECTFCKRGFTNGQALGGHMNIHRKDRAKAKQVSPADKDYMINMSPRCYPVMEGERNYGMFFPSPRQYGYCESDNYMVHRSLQPSSCLSHEELLGANLSLRIGSDEGQAMRRIMKDDDDVDLELRLGHDP